MRNIKKVLSTTTYNVLMYDTVKKCEVEKTIKKTELEKEISIPKNHIVISKVAVMSEKRTYVLTPKEFVEYATIEPLEQATE